MYVSKPHFEDSGATKPQATNTIHVRFACLCSKIHQVQIILIYLIDQPSIKIRFSFSYGTTSL